MLSRTYVVAFFVVADNPKRDMSHYLKYLTVTLDYLSDQNLVFISNSEKLNAAVAGYKAGKAGGCVTRLVALSDLERAQYAAQFVEAVKGYGETKTPESKRIKKDKGDAHYYRDFLMGTEASYQSVMTIWHSKVKLLAEVARENPFGTEEVCWVDASVSRSFFIRKGWDFHPYVREPGKVCCFPNGMAKHKRILRANAGVILTDVASALRLEEACERHFQALLPEPYPNDEEIVLDAVFGEAPEWLRHIPTCARRDHSVMHTRQAIAGAWRILRLRLLLNDRIGGLFRTRALRSAFRD